MLAAHAVGGPPSARRPLVVRVDRVIVDGPTAAQVLADGPPVDPARWAAVAAAGPLDAGQRAVAEQGRRAGLALALDASRAGRPGVVAADEGLVGRDDLVVGTGPDVGGLGGLGAVALKVGPAELLALRRAPEMLTALPPVRFVRVSGRLPRWVGPFDLARELAARAADGRGAYEFHGETIAAFDVPERLALCEALARRGLSALVPPDARTVAWLAARQARPPSGPLPALHEVPAQAEWIELDARRVRLAADRGAAALRVEAEDGPPVDEALLEGRVEELRVAAEVLRDRNVKRGLVLLVVPASQRALVHAIDEGLAADLVRAGAILLPPGQSPPASTGARRVATSVTRDDEIVAGAAVVAASAIAGRLIDPEGMRRSHRRRARLV